MAMTPGKVLEPLLRTNVSGTYYVCREVAKVMILQRSGRIITLSSMAVGLHEEGTSAYSASKSAVVEMTKILAKELAPLGITSNVIAPSMVKTEALEALGQGVIARALQKLTIKRTLTIEEICNVISFFAAPDSACITGQVIHMGLVV
jgi:3-oxoacyl-[acyl-carrier protein] reductase